MKKENKTQKIGSYVMNLDAESNDVYVTDSILLDSVCEMQKNYVCEVQNNLTFEIENGSEKSIELQCRKNVNFLMERIIRNVSEGIKHNEKIFIFQVPYAIHSNIVRELTDIKLGFDSFGENIVRYKNLNDKIIKKQVALIDGESNEEIHTAPTIYITNNYNFPKWEKNKRIPVTHSKKFGKVFIDEFSKTSLDDNIETIRKNSYLENIN